MKRISCTAMLILLILTWMPTAARAVGTSASSAVLMEASSGRLLYEKGAHDRRLIASTTKLMTALVAVELTTDLDAPVKVGAESCGIEGSSIYLRPGEILSLRELLLGLLLQSGNDAAHAVAMHCAGSVEAFARAMNEKAKALGMEDSHFSNPSGLNADDHYSTAYDMALLARAVLQHPELAEIAATKSAAIAGGRVVTNHNKLLWRYEGCVGMKTGYTEKAGRTLVSAATRGGMTLICVTLNDPDDWRDHTALLDHGFAGWSPVVLTTRGSVVARIPVSGGLQPFLPVEVGESVLYPLASGEVLEKELLLDHRSLSAPVYAGASAGRLVFRVDGREVASVPLIYGHGAPAAVVPERGPFQRLMELWSGEG